MDVKKENKPNILSDRYQNVLNSLSKCKIDFVNEKEDSKKIREINSKLEVELTEARELEKSHRYHLLASREMIGNLQDTVSQLVYLKRDVKRLKEEVVSKDAAIAAAERDKDNFLLKQNENVFVQRNAHERELEDLTSKTERRIQQVQFESDTQVAQLTCVIEELRCKIKEMEAEHQDKINVVVLEYEEKIQRGSAQVAQLQEQLTRQGVRTEANMDAYRRRLEELEEKLKQSQFKQYLAQGSYASQYESQVERPYSVDRDPYPDSFTAELDPVPENSKTKPLMNNQNKAPRPSNRLQVMYYENKPSNAPKNAEKKGQPFNITKKRKLFNE